MSLIKVSCFLWGIIDRTDYVIHWQVASTDGVIQRAVSVRGQGGLLLGVDAPFLGSLPPWVPSCLPLSLLRLLGGANWNNKVFQAGWSEVLLNFMVQGTHSYIYCHITCRWWNLTPETVNIKGSKTYDWW